MDEILSQPEIPKFKEVHDLPTWAAVAFVARCGRLIQHKFSGSDWLYEKQVAERVGTIDRVLSFAEETAAAGSTNLDKAANIGNDAQQAFFSAHGAWSEGAIGDAHLLFFIFHIFNLTVCTAGLDAPPKGQETLDMQAACKSIEDFMGFIQRYGSNSSLLASAIQKDFGLLKTIAQNDLWSDRTPVSPDFFAVHSDFEFCNQLEESGIISISAEINSKLVDYFRRWPNRLFSLTSRQFEELIAELFSGFGYDVELTKRTRDGGCDIVAISNLPVNTKLLIECKRYEKDRTVGVDVVRSLHGVTIADGANKGILVTTGRISKDARRFMTLPNTKWLLEGHDFDGLIQWLQLYQQFQIGKISKLTSIIDRNK